MYLNTITPQMVNTFTKYLRVQVLAFPFHHPSPLSARYCMHAQVHCGAYVTCVFVLFLAIVRSSTCIKLRIPPQLGINRFSLSSIEGLD